MVEISQEQLRSAVQNQASMRLKLGSAVALIALVFNLLATTGGGEIRSLVVFVGYVAYVTCIYLVTRHPRGLQWRQIAIGTAILDPLVLSVWLYAEGEQATLLLAFYLFTILGFGFRIGPGLMRLCQVVSILAFTLVLFHSPFWTNHLLFGASHLILLVIVPLYAHSLISELHGAKAHAERESKAKSHLLANVSHELRTPLTGIVSAAQLLEHRATSPEDARLAKTIVSLSGSLDAEISQLLDLSRTTMQTSAPPGPFHLRVVLRSVEAALQEAARAKGITFIAELDPAIRKDVVGSAHELTSVLLNLAGNAVKFTHEGTVAVRIRLVSEDETSYRLWIGVKDTGIGIAEEHQKHLFEPFYRVENGNRRQYRGTGLGATIALENVRRMGGELQLRSAEGEGSTFWFEVTMPICSIERPVAQTTAAPIVSPKSILIADDNALNLELLHQMLLKDGHDVTAAGSGREAIAHLANFSFDVVMLDYNMSDMDGLSVYQLYVLGRLYPAPTFFITADTSTETATRLNDAGASGLVYKPLTFDKLRGAVASVFPREQGASPKSMSVQDKPTGRLAPVPVEHVDLSVLATLREIKDQPAFIHKMISDGMADIDQLLLQVTSAIATGDTAALHLSAHAMKGVALNVGAVRLGAQCEQLMTLTTSQLQVSRDRLRTDIVFNTQSALAALDQLRSPFGGATKSA